MELKELLQYIKDAIDLETDIATQTKICDDTKQIVLSQQPQLQLLKAPDKPRGIFVEDGSDAAPAWIVGAVSCFLFGIFMFTVAVELFLVFTVVGFMLLLCFFWRKQKYRQDVAAARQKFDRMQQEYEHTSMTY